MKSLLLSFERRSARAVALALLGTTLVTACDDDRAADPISPKPTTPSTIVRTVSTGALTWRTTGTGNQFQFIGGAKFQIVGPQNATWLLTDNVLPDIDPAAGKFKLASLASGAYTVCEVGAPTGHAIASTPCQTAIVAQGATTDVGVFVSDRHPSLALAYQDNAKNFIPFGVFAIQDSLGNPVIVVADNGMNDQDKTDGKIFVTLPGPGKYNVCKLIPPAGWLVPSWLPTCEQKTLSNNMSMFVSAFVVPPYSVTWSVVAGLVPLGNPLWLAGAKFTITKIDGSPVLAVTDNDVNDRQKLDGIFYVKLPGAGSYVICQAGAIPGHYMVNPPCHTVTAEYGKVTWNDYYINPEKQVIYQ